MAQTSSSKGGSGSVSPSPSPSGGDSVPESPTPSPSENGSVPESPTPSPSGGSSGTKNPPSPYVLKARVISPGFETGWSETQLSVPLHGQVQLKWDAALSNHFLPLFTSDCQIRRVSKDGKTSLETLVDNVGLTGEAAFYVNHLNPLIANDLFSYAHYCRFVNSGNYGATNFERRIRADVDICENPFDNIVKSLRENKITRITEDNFRDWADADDFDYCDYSSTDGKCARNRLSSSSPIWGVESLQRSGDRSDIKEAMSLIQQDYLEDSTVASLQELLKNDLKTIGSLYETLRKIKEINDQGQPTFVAEVVYEERFDPTQHQAVLSPEVFAEALSKHNKGELVLVAEYGPGPGRHATIALKTREIKTPGSGEVVGYNFEVLDSNYVSDPNPSITPVVNLSCTRRTTYFAFINRAGAPRQLVKLDPGRYVCDRKTSDGNQVAYSILVNRNYPIDSLRTAFTAHCRKHSQSKMCQERQANMSAWLRDNYPLVGNFATFKSLVGNCFGWTDFILRTTYLGDFVGECPRPPGT